MEWFYDDVTFKFQLISHVNMDFDNLHLYPAGRAMLTKINFYEKSKQYSCTLFSSTSAIIVVYKVRKKEKTFYRGVANSAAANFTTLQIEP